MDFCSIDVGLSGLLYINLCITIRVLDPLYINMCINIRVPDPLYINLCITIRVSDPLHINKNMYQTIADNFKYSEEYAINLKLTKFTV